MAVQGYEKVETPKEFKNFTDRDYQWIWNYIQLYKYYPQISKNSLLKRRDLILRHIQNSNDKESIINGLLIEKENFLIKDDYLNWIQPNDDRLTLWCLVSAINQFNISNYTPNSLSYYEEFINILDNINCNLDLKISFITQLKINWSLLKTSDIEIKWLKKDNTSQLNWAWSYLIKNNKNCPIFIHPSTNEDLYNKITSSFDLMTNPSNPYEKELFLIKMKKTWSQKKFRDSGKAKKPYHLPLSDQTYKELEYLTGILNKPTTQVLEFIIEKAYNDYLTGKERVSIEKKDS